jgi:hypothetical protein
MRIIAAVLLCVGICHAEIDSGCVREYIAATGITNWNEAAVWEWDNARQAGKVQTNVGSVAYSGSVAAGTGIEAPTIDGTKIYRMKFDNAGQPVAVIAAESPHKTEAVIDALFIKQAATNDTLRAEIKALRLQIATNIADTAALIATGTNAIAELQALTFSTTPTRAQVQALRNEVVDTTRILNDSLRELKDANQAMQHMRRVLGALYKEE